MNNSMSADKHKQEGRLILDFTSADVWRNGLRASAAGSRHLDRHMQQSPHRQSQAASILHKLQREIDLALDDAEVGTCLAARQAVLKRKDEVNTASRDAAKRLAAVASTLRGKNSSGADEMCSLGLRVGLSADAEGIYAAANQAVAIVTAMRERGKGGDAEAMEPIVVDLCDTAMAAAQMQMMEYQAEVKPLLSLRPDIDGIHLLHGCEALLYNLSVSSLWTVSFIDQTIIPLMTIDTPVWGLLMA